MPSESERVRVRAGVPADLLASRRVFRRSSLSNEGDREALLANPHMLELSARGGSRKAGRESRSEPAKRSSAS
jgi:hypothetical protein